MSTELHGERLAGFTERPPTRGTSVGRRARKRGFRRHDWRKALLFLAPWLFGFIVLQAYPLLMTAYYSVTDYNGLNFPPHFVGLQNYIQAFTDDPLFWTSVRVTIWWVVVSVRVTLAVALALALLLQGTRPGVGVYRTLIYLPSMVPAVGAGIVFAWIFNPSSGPVDQILRWVGFQGPNWFTSPGWAKPGLVLLSVWQVGPTMIIFLAGLQAIPAELLEAAMIEGAGRWRRFRSIVLPLLTPTVFFNLILGMIGSFTIFTQALAVSVTANNSGGQAGAAYLGAPGNSTLFYAVNMYQVMFQNFQFGYGSALSVILTIVTVLATAALFVSAKRWVFYGGDQ